MAGAAGFLGLALILGLRIIGNQLYDYPPNPPINEIPAKAVIICLAGGRGRVHAAIDLFAKGIGSELIIVGAGPKTKVPAILKSIFSAPGAPKLSKDRLGKILLEKDSRNTIENAYAIENYLRQNPQVHEIVLITSAYHMRRSLLVLQSLARKNVRIFSFCPEKETIARENWSHSFIGIGVTIEEYSKLILAKMLTSNLSYF